jgi:hypothetical protein
MIDPVRSRTQRVVSYGPLRTIVELEDRGWQLPGRTPLNMTVRYTQYAGHRDTQVDVFFNDNVDGQQFSTGIINVKGSEEYSDHHGLRACWGTDYPSTDTVKWSRETVGLAILLQQPNIVSEQPANKDNYAFVVATGNRHITYHIAYCSANETFGFHNAKEWFGWTAQWRREVDNPVKVSLKAIKN